MGWNTMKRAPKKAGLRERGICHAPILRMDLQNPSLSRLLSKELFQDKAGEA